jgi:hypothetical protein
MVVYGLAVSINCVKVGSRSGHPALNLLCHVDTGVATTCLKLRAALRFNAHMN